MRKYAWNEDVRVDLTPMLDIVFIMLIFFIVTASFTKELGLAVPQAPKGPPPPPGEESIILKVDASNRVYIFDNGFRLTDVRRVRANIAQQRAANPEATVIIQAESKASTGIVVGVYDQVLLVDKSIPVTVVSAE